MSSIINWRTSLWLLFSTVLVPALLSIAVGILMLVFYDKAWDLASGVLVLCFAIFSVVGTVITVFLLRRYAALAQLQTDFIANMSHDFRTPLTSIRMFVETLRAGRAKDQEEQQRCLDMLAQETERMERMVDMVLVFRQLEEPAKGLKLSPHDPMKLACEAISPFQVEPSAARRLELVEEPNLPRVLADADLVVEAVRNLVGNALKHGPVDGAVVITLRNYGEGVAISVRDQGRAIPQAERKRIFNRFYRIAGTNKPGSGVGLAIVAETAKVHGGSVDLKCSPDAGNVFTLWLPMVVVADPLLAGQQAPAPAGQKE